MSLNAGLSPTLLASGKDIPVSVYTARSETTAKGAATAIAIAKTATSVGGYLCCSDSES